MSDTVVVDQKMRIRLPQKVSKALGVKSKEALSISVEDGKIIISRSKKSKQMSPFMKDIFERPLHSKIPITKELLDALEEEQWSGL